MKSLILNRNKLIFGVAIWGLLFAALSITHSNQFEILNIVGFLFLSLVPGILTVQNFKLPRLPFFGILSLSVALSLLELMVVALVGNALWPFFGIERPLDQPALIMDVGLLILALSVTAWWRLPGWELDVAAALRGLFPSTLNTVLSFAPILFVLQSVAGAISLNNGGTNLWTFFMLGEIGVYIIILTLLSDKVEENTILTGLFFTSLSLLLMTSLRGYYITGHDIQTEFRVFELAKNAGVWSMSAFRDAYNACMSITILPTVFFNLMRFPDQYVYKFFFQIFFAFCPPIVYLISRHWANRWMSLLAATYFISFPTFFWDMPFLNRQEIAFLFFGLMLWVIFEGQIDIKIRRWLFLGLGLGVILSHYSTTYTILFIFLLAVAILPILSKVLSYFVHIILNESSLQTDVPPPAHITYWMIGILMVLNLLWTSVITHTGGNVVVVLRETVTAAVNGFTGADRSVDAANLVAFRKVNQQAELNAYITKYISPTRTSATPGTYYSNATYDRYPEVALEDETLPPTHLGQLLGKFHINVNDVVPLFGQSLAKLLEILGPIGLLYLLFRRSIITNIDREYFVIAGCSLFFVALNVVLPILSTQYGVNRAILQTMFVLGLFMIVGSVLIGEWIAALVGFLFKRLGRVLPYHLSRTNISFTFALVVTMMFFFFSTGFIPQLLGGLTEPLHLNNAGRYYDNYLIKDSDVSGVEWLSSTAHVDTKNTPGVIVLVQTDPYSGTRFISLTSLKASNDIFPGIIRKDAYVFLGSAAVHSSRATVVYGGDQVTYKYPVQFLQNNKDLIYNNGQVNIFR